MNTSNKTLLQILVEELPKRGGWPKGADQCAQDGKSYEFRVCFYSHGELNYNYDQFCISEGSSAKWIRNGCSFIAEIASDQETTIITRDQYEAALAEKENPLPWDDKKTDADGWIDWAGGECPIVGVSFVEYKMRSGEVHKEYAHLLRWDHKGHLGDILAYRLHQPQEVTEADDETDLNECIDQTPAPVWDGEGLPPVGAEFNYGLHRSRAKCLAVGLHYVFASKGDPDDEEGDYEEFMIDAGTDFYPVDEKRDLLMRDIMKAAGIMAGTAETIANRLIDAGYRKQ